MYFKDIEIQNFRGIKHGSIESLNSINFFVGKNNCGKTSVLEALFLLTGISNSSLINNIHQFRGLNLNDIDDLKLIYYGLDLDNDLILSACQYDGTKRKLHILANSDEVIIDKNTEHNTADISSTSGMVKSTINQLVLNFEIQEKSKKAKKHKSKFWLSGNVQKYHNDKNYIEKMNGVYIPPNYSMSSTLEQTLDSLIKEKKEKEIVEILNIIDSKIKNIKFGQNYIYIDTGYDTLIPLNLAGDGIRRILSIVLGIYHKRNSILLIDELDIGLHCTIMPELIKAIVHSAIKFNVQIFATTHNLEILRYLTEAFNDENAEKQSSIAIYTLRRNNDGQIKSYRYDYEALHHAIQNGIEVR